MFSRGLKTVVKDSVERISLWILNLIFKNIAFSVLAQWSSGLRLCTFNAGDVGLIPGQETKMWYGQTMTTKKTSLAMSQPSLSCSDCTLKGD